MANGRLNMAGNNNFAKNGAKFILRKVGDRLLSMYHQERTRALEAVLKKKIYDLTFEEVQAMDEQ